MQNPTRLLLAAVPVLLLGAWACGDAPTSPEALLVTPETQAALEVGESLPRLPDFLAAAGAPDTGLARAAALWKAADSLADQGEDDEGMRRQAYETAVPGLAARLDTAALHGLERRLERWSSLAESAMRRADLPDIAARLGSGRALLVDARQAEADGDMTAAVQAALLASDRLAATTPRAVAARLTADGEALLSRLEFERAGRPGDAERRRLERADRLVRGAREALAAGDYQLAIRRAFYARELLRGGGS